MTELQGYWLLSVVTLILAELHSWRMAEGLPRYSWGFVGIAAVWAAIGVVRLIWPEL